SRMAAKIFNLIRRVVPATTEASAWTVKGHDAEGREEFEAEVFAGLGVLARAAPDGEPEAIVVSVQGSANHPVIVAVRDRATERKVLKHVTLREGETLVHNGQMILHLQADGIRIGRAGGTFRRVALEGHTHFVNNLPVTGGGGGTVSGNTQGPSLISDDLEVS
ncbi:MAG: hypothetical protein ACPGVG_00340, partial [Mycobacterium sp.]